ncbi:hypothetical protein [Natronoglomus mannanivorans]|uniref:hypothetical protein n=1 Tax=Natronoglomus mannanivorans TaxID=2979990 RepID=UPI003CCCD494
MDRFRGGFRVRRCGDRRRRSYPREPPRDDAGSPRTELERAVTRQGGDVSVISSDLERGARLADTFGQVGALLRFPVQ